MPLGMEVGLCPGDFVYDGDSATARTEGAPPPASFWTMFIVAKRLDGWRRQLGTEVDLGPDHVVLDGDPAPPAKGEQQPPHLFGPCILWPRSPISATAELLLYCCCCPHRCFCCWCWWRWYSTWCSEYVDWSTSLFPTYQRASTWRSNAKDTSPDRRWPTPPPPHWYEPLTTLDRERSESSNQTAKDDRC